jgi:hypothetical protein
MHIGVYIYFMSDIKTNENKLNHPYSYRLIELYEKTSDYTVYINFQVHQKISIVHLVKMIFETEFSIECNCFNCI